MRHLAKKRVFLSGTRSVTSAPSVGVGWGAPENSDVDVIGWQNKSQLSSKTDFVPIWTAKPIPQPAAEPSIKVGVNVQPNISTPVTTPVTAAVSPVLNVAAGSTGVTQGASTDQQATPTTTNTTPQGTITPAPVASGGDNTYILQLLEQQAREQAALRDQAVNLAKREAEINAAAQLANEREKIKSAANAERAAVDGAKQTPNLQQNQDTPIPLQNATPASAPIAIVNAGQGDANSGRTGLLIAALAAVAFFAMQNETKTAKKNRRKQHARILHSKTR